MTTFTNNSADNVGGGINWDTVEPNFDTSTTYINNSAKNYGNNIACFP